MSDPLEPNFDKDLTLTDLRDYGLIWAINKMILHPRGYAMSINLDHETGEAIGWNILGNGTEPHSFDEGSDLGGFTKFQKLLAQLS